MIGITLDSGLSFANTEDVSNLSVGGYGVSAIDQNGCVTGLTTGFGPCIQEGCTDPEACNYDDTATTDDSSCEYLMQLIYVVEIVYLMKIRMEFVI